ncbi:cysteine dioxygenase [Hyalangium minutum]|uniref:Xanthine dehydrogenase, molybdenum binding subunit protein n=1 Tax=Hyalangium minutum TaxID=394096 RepID=A0A085WLJ7_9BACT|nr:cysteine dioxygenase family protein [Hyalangium minutum]KFE68560.1 Xanthine dehydrogenase, molybdenum binding subunit protein [Hyalangium minutum]
MPIFRGVYDVALEDVLRCLREEVHGACGAVKVGQRLEGVLVRPESLGPYLHFRRGRYTRNLVYRDPRFEVVLNCWDAGISSPIHDHAEQECWFSIQAGTFLLEDYPLLAGGREPGYALLGKPRPSEAVGPGHVDYRGPLDSIHRVTALQGPAVTLHVYASPVEQCLVFDVRRQRCATRQLCYHSVFGRPVEARPSAELPGRL